MLKCELCGETIIKTDDNVFVCEGCGCRYTKEQATKLLGKSSTKPTTSDFVIVAGILKEYKGQSVDVVIPDGVLEIGTETFHNMSSLQTVKIPFSVKVIQDSAFSLCTSLREVSLNEGIEIIGRKAFSHCKNLQAINLPKSLSSLSEGCFAGCTSLRKIDLPTNLKHIGEGAFSGCGELTELIIPDSVESIGCVTTYDGDTIYHSILGCYSYSDFAYGYSPENLTVRMPKRFDGRLVEGCKYLFDLSGHTMDTAEDYEKRRVQRRVRENWRRQHLCLSCGGEIGFFSNRCKRCGKPYGTE